MTPAACVLVPCRLRAARTPAMSLGVLTLSRPEAHLKFYHLIHIHIHLSLRVEAPTQTSVIYISGQRQTHNRIQLTSSVLVLDQLEMTTPHLKAGPTTSTLYSHSN